VDAVLGSPRSHAALIAVAVVLALVAAPRTARAHAFPDHSEPRVGHTVERSPTEVRIWFDGALEPVFSKLEVVDAAGHRVDRDDAHVDAHDDTLLEVSLPPLEPGRYQAAWSVVARDGHRTEGRFPFTVASP
jgi:methionine-rich copper-binding protein CopC